MDNYTLLGRTIEDEYQKYHLGENPDSSSLLMHLKKYMEGIIAKTISFDGHTDMETVEDIAQDALVVIIENTLDSFEMRNAKFASYCGTIAKNMAIDYLRRMSRRQMVHSDDIVEIMDTYQKSDGVGLPDEELEKTQRQLGMIDGVKEYIKILTELQQKPYRLVSYGYTSILFHYYNPERKNLGSPKWAYEHLEKETVADGGEDFIYEINNWLPYLQARWSDQFYDALDDKKDDMYIGDIVFGEHFKPKDFENWSTAIQGIIKSEMHKKSCEFDF